MKFRKGRIIPQKTLKASPRYKLPVAAKEKRTMFQSKPMALPKASIPSFMLGVPFNSKVRHMKIRLKNKRISAASRLMNWSAAITHSAIAVKNSPESKRSAMCFFQFTFPSGMPCCKSTGYRG